MDESHSKQKMADEAASDVTIRASLEVSRRGFLQIAGGGVSLVGLSAAAISAQRLPQDSAAPSEAANYAIGLSINGTWQHLEVDPRMSLLDVLRERLQLTGTKKGCNQGACGACTVLLNGKRVNSCLTLAVMHDGARVTTIEGLANGATLHPLQSAFIQHDAFQCGYCTSGQIMSGIACISEGHTRSIEEIKHWMSGNICRCGAYPGICSAISEVSKSTSTTES